MVGGGEGKGEGLEEGEWEQVGPKNKSTITRQVSWFVNSLIPMSAMVTGPIIVGVACDGVVCEC